MLHHDTATATATRGRRGWLGPGATMAVLAISFVVSVGGAVALATVLGPPTPREVASPAAAASPLVAPPEVEALDAVEVPTSQPTNEGHVDQALTAPPEQPTPRPRPRPARPSADSEPGGTRPAAPQVASDCLDSDDPLCGVGEEIGPGIVG